jgi:hypothetical protein
MKNRKFLLVLLSYAIIASVLVGCSSAVSPTATIHQVKYVVQSNSMDVLVSMINSQGGTEQKSVDVYSAGEQASWTFTMYDGDPASIVAQENIGYGLAVTCIIYVDGMEWKRSYSQGNFVTATCSGIIGNP